MPLKNEVTGFLKKHLDKKIEVGTMKEERGNPLSSFVILIIMDNRWINKQAISINEESY